MRKLSGFWKYFVSAASVLLILFHLYTTGFGVLQDMIQRTVHMSFVLSLLFILKPAYKGAPKDRVPVYDIVLAGLSVVCCAYVLMHAEVLLWDALAWFGTVDKILAVVTVILILEVSRRSVGLAFPVMAVIMFFYTFQGELFPGVWVHRNFRFDVVFQTLYHTTTGVWGQMIGLSAVMLAMFAIFGSVLSFTGGSQTFIKFGQMLFGKSIGGQGKVSLIASGLFGMISGTALGNVVATGTFTIPMMKKANYNREWAAAIASVGAAGGAIMPPMMGAGAFIMAEFLGIPYFSVAAAAVVSAVLYYYGAAVAVHYVSKKNGIVGVPQEVKILPKEYLVILIPIAVFVAYLVAGYAVANAAFYATLVGAATYIVTNIVMDRKGDPALKKLGRMGHKISLDSASAIIDMAGLLGGAQIIITLISLTGLAVKLSDMIVSLGGQNLFLCLLFSMVVCIVLGMGLPITACYVLGASILAPALITLGLDSLVAHLFVFYFCCLAVITPPVCGAVYLASGIAESQWFRTGVLACFIALPGFIVPYTFAYNPALILRGGFVNIAVSCVTALVGVTSIGMGVAGFTNRNRAFFSRILFVLAGVLLVIPNYMWSLVGLAVFAVLLIDVRKLRKLPGKSSPPGKAEKGGGSAGAPVENGS